MDPQEPVLVQGVAFVMAGLTGVAVGLGTDGYRAVIRALRPHRWLAHALDVAFVLAAVPVVAAGLLAANWGALRVYPLAALLAGFGLYLGLASPVLLPALTRLADGVVAVVCGASRVASWPFRHLRTPVLGLARTLGAWRSRWGRPQGPPDPPIPGAR